MRKRLRRLVSIVLRLLISGIRLLAWIVVLAWTTLAIYFSNLPWSALRLAGAVAFAAFAIWAVWIARRRSMRAVTVALVLGVVAWWFTISPSGHRNWRPEVAVMPRAFIDGDRVRLTGVRNFDYRGRNDFTVHYEDREVQLSHLVGLDFYVSYWSEGPVAHTFVSFLFDDAAPVSISIETRPTVGRGFEPLASMFKQFELIYVVGEERDVVGVRVIHRGEAVYLYHLNTVPEDARRLFMIYLARINALADHPEFYNLLTNSCTINIIRYANAAGRKGSFDIRHLFNGMIDGYLYASGRVDTTLPFEELRRRSLINAAAQAADSAPEPDFSRLIRATLPTVEK